MLSKKYLTVILAILLTIAAAVLAVSQIFIGDEDQQVVPFSVGPSGPPYVTPPTSPPPSN